MLIIFMVTQCHNRYHLMKISLKETFFFEDFLNIPGTSDFGYFFGVDLSYPYIIIQTTKHCPFAPENEIINKDDFNEHMKKMNQKNIYHIKNRFLIGQKRDI